MVDTSQDDMMRASIRRADNVRKIGLLYDLVPRRHDYSNLILELKSLNSDLVALETMLPSLMKDNITTLINHKLNTGENLYTTLSSQVSTIAELETTVEERDCQIAQCERTNAMLKIEIAHLENSYDCLEDQVKDKIVNLEAFARTAMAYIETLSSPSFLNISKKDRQLVDDIRSTYEELF